MSGERASLAQGTEHLTSETFLRDYCLDCHSGAEAEGERDLESLDLNAHDLSTQMRVQEVIDQLNLQTMPPDDGDQPEMQVRQSAIDSLSSLLAEMRQRSSSTGQRTVIRRLSAREYQNTLSDLLGIEMTMFDPTVEFPSEETGTAFDNVGDSLVMSGYLLENYLKAADLSVEKAFQVTSSQAQQTWRFEDGFYQQAELATGHRKAFNNRFICLYDHPFNDKIEGGYGPIANFKSGVPVDGVYEVRVLAKAMHRDSPYSDRALRLDLDEPFRLGIRAGDTRIADMVHRQPIQPLLGEQIVEDGDFRWYRFEVRLDTGFAPRFTFENGHHDFRGMVGRLYRYDRAKLPESIRDKKGIFEQRIALIASAEIPHIRIDEVEIRGPIDYDWPNSSRRLLLEDAELDESHVENRLDRFASRAFRRTATADEVAELLRFFRSRRVAGESAEQAFKNTLKVVLCSPEFLYFHRSEDGLDSDFALAERLSYFLTSSMPDERLMTLARDGKLGTQNTLRSEVKRLLASDDSRRFVNDFLDSWLSLRDLGSMPPDTKDFWFYYAANLERDMKTETQLFFKDMIERNAPALELIEARHSFLNRDLAKLYKIENETPPSSATEFRRVEFQSPQRGGLLGQASVLTVTANGIDTSPVIRGVWMLEKILGTPTPPPPDDVPAIDPDTRGATTIRQQLEKHRLSDTCNHCHRKIDPLGFSLECFDAIGQSRTHYDKSKRKPVDTSGDLPGGRTFLGVADLKVLLASRQEFFVRTLTENLLTHALGRRVEPADRAELDQIIGTVKEDGYRLASLIEAIVLSDLFRR
ncbi:MAG: DUF1592 domain-containing protein [Aureliella sp.]